MRGNFFIVDISMFLLLHLQSAFVCFSSCNVVSKINVDIYKRVMLYFGNLIIAKVLVSRTLELFYLCIAVIFTVVILLFYYYYFIILLLFHY